jgi:hypothetical protein
VVTMKGLSARVPTAPECDPPTSNYAHPIDSPPTAGKLLTIG